MKALNIQWERKGVARALIAIRRLKPSQAAAYACTGNLSSEGSYRDQAFEASMLIRKAIAKSVPRDVIAVRRLKHPEAPYHKKASLWSFEAPERGLLVIGRALLESSLF